MELIRATSDTRDWDRALSFYATHFKGVHLSDDENVFLTLIEGGPIAGVRIAPEEDALTLRTMLVLPRFQRLGLGRQLLEFVSPFLEGKLVYCLPKNYLEKFYGQVGFEAIASEDLPVLLQERLRDYADLGCIAMRKLAE